MKKYFFCFALLIIVWTLSRKINSENVKFLMNIFERYQDLIKHDAYISFILLLNISDLNIKMASLNYYYLINTLVLFSNLLPSSYKSLTRTFTTEIQYFFLEIFSSVISFITQGGIMIQELNLDELIIECLVFFLRKVRLE